MDRPLNDLTQPSSSPLIRPLDLLLVAVLTFAAFVPNVRGQFSPVDDYTMLLLPPQLHNPTWAGYFQYWTRPFYRLYMPITLSVWQVIAHFANDTSTTNPLWLSPMPFKLVSNLLHATSAVAAAWAVSMLTRSRWPAVAGGLLFGLHPVQAESVCWTTGMKDVLCGAFALGSVGFYTRWLLQRIDSPWRGGQVKQSWRWFVALALAVLSMLSKPTGMMLPLSLVAVDVALRRVPLVRRLPALAPFAIPAVCCGLIIIAVQNDPLVPHVPVWARPLIVGDSVSFYLWKIAVPLHLTEDYGRHPEAVWNSGQIWWTWVLGAAVLVALLACKNRLGLVAVGLFLAPLLPVSGISKFDMQQYSTVNDHYVYQSMLGVALLAAVALKAARPWAGAAAAVVLIGLGILTWQQARLWQNPWDYYQYVLRQNPRSWMARALLAGMASETGDTTYALVTVDQAIALSPNYGSAYGKRSETLLRLGRYREAAADLRQVIKIGLGTGEMGRKLMKLGAILGDPDMALDGVRAWLKSEPGDPRAVQIFNKLSAAADRAAASQPTSQSKSPPVPGPERSGAER